MASIRSKYIIPFSFKSLEYNELHKKSDSWNIDEGHSIESDIYEYVQQSFITSANSADADPSTKIACLYKYVGSHLPENFRLKFKIKINDKDITRYFYMREVHVALFQTGVGFIWFVPELSGKDIGVEEIIDFTYNLKELARNEKANNFYKESIEDVGDRTDIPVEQIIPGGKQYKKDIPFFVGEWIDDIARTMTGEITYYPSRTKTRNGVGRVLPDKAVLFHCGTIVKREDTNHSIVYLSRGYKQSYRLREDVDKDLYQPFDNVKCYASSEGCGYYATLDPDDHAFFMDLSKVNRDYFLLFLLALYQSYTLLKYSELIANKLSARSDDYNDYSKELEDNLDEITTGMDVFLAKSVYSSVSHVQQQNEFFNYVSERLRIQDNISSVTAGIGALNNIENGLYDEELQKKNHFLEVCLTIVSLLAVLSAFNDGNDFVRKYMHELFAPNQPIEIYVVNIILLIIALIIISLLFKYLIYKPNRKKKSKKKR